MEPSAGTVRQGSCVTSSRLLGAGLPTAAPATAPNYPPRRYVRERTHAAQQVFQSRASLNCRLRACLTGFSLTGDRAKAHFPITRLIKTWAAHCYEVKSNDGKCDNDFG